MQRFAEDEGRSVVTENRFDHIEFRGDSVRRATRRDVHAFPVTLADGASPHDLHFFEATDEMVRGEVVERRPDRRGFIQSFFAYAGNH